MTTNKKKDEVVAEEEAAITNPLETAERGPDSRLAAERES
jgi:hypothetical protein